MTGYKLADYICQCFCAHLTWAWHDLAWQSQQYLTMSTYECDRLNLQVLRSSNHCCWFYIVQVSISMIGAQVNVQVQLQLQVLVLYTWCHVCIFMSGRYFTCQLVAAAALRRCAPCWKMDEHYLQGQNRACAAGNSYDVSRYWRPCGLRVHVWNACARSQ